MIIFDISKYYCIFVIETMIIELLSKHNAEIVTRLNRWIKRIFTCNKLKISDLIIIFGSQAVHIETKPEGDKKKKVLQYQCIVGLFINRKTFRDSFSNHFVSVLHLLTQNKL